MGYLYHMNPMMRIQATDAQTGVTVSQIHFDDGDSSITVSRNPDPFVVGPSPVYYRHASHDAYVGMCERWGLNPDNPHA